MVLRNIGEFGIWGAEIALAAARASPPCRCQVFDRPGSTDLKFHARVVGHIGLPGNRPEGGMLPTSSDGDR